MNGITNDSAVSREEKTSVAPPSNNAETDPYLKIFDVRVDYQGVGQIHSPTTPLFSDGRSPKACWCRKFLSLRGAIMCCLVICLTAGFTIFSMRWYFEKCNKCNRPSLLMMVRHGEKPHKGDGLSTIGLCRAEKFLSLFNGEIFPKPDLLYTWAPSEGRPSRRGVETLLPLSQELNIPITTYKNHLYEKMLADILENDLGKTALLAWHHNTPNIGELALAFGVDQEAVNKYYATLKDYDAIWWIEFAYQGNKLLTNLTIKSEGLGTSIC